MSSVRIIKGCQRCGVAFLGTKRSQKWCGNACRTAVSLAKRKRLQSQMLDELFRRANQIQSQEQRP